MTSLCTYRHTLLINFVYSRGRETRLQKGGREPRNLRRVGLDYFDGDPPRGYANDCYM